MIDAAAVIAVAEAIVRWGWRRRWSCMKMLGSLLRFGRKVLLLIGRSGCMVDGLHS